MQAQQGAKLERAGAVTLGDVDRSRQGLLGGARVRRLQQLAAEAVELRLPCTLVVLLGVRQRIGDLRKRAICSAGAHGNPDETQSVVRSSRSTRWRVECERRLDLCERVAGADLA